MPLPSPYVVELYFGSSGYVDVTSYVNSITIGKGISRQLDDYSAGTLSVSFSNNDRTFDPLNTSSILWYGPVSTGYTLVQPGGKIRVSTAGVRRFTGFIQSWDFTYDQAGFDGQAQVVALDEMFRVSNASFTGGYAWAVEPTSERIKTVMNYNGFGASEYSGVRGGETMLGTDTWNAGDNVLSYLQNVARSEPGDFYSNASAVMQFKDRSFTNYAWVNTSRKNYVNYPSTAVGSALTVEAGGTYQWVLIGVANTAIPSQFGGTVYRAGTVIASPISESFTGFEYQNINLDRYAASGSQYVFSAYLRGISSGNYEGQFAFLGTAGQLLQQTSITQASSGTGWTRVGGTATYSGTSVIGGVDIVFGITQDPYTTGTAVAGEGFQIEPGTAFINYFDGGYNPYVSDATNRYGVAWADGAYSSTSGLVSASATAISAPTIYTFADANSQGASYGNGTGIPFMDLNVAYGGEQLYNQVQVAGVNATAVVSDTVGQSLYGLRAYSQTDNLTTSLTAPAKIAAGLLGEFRLPEYRATSMTVALEALTAGQQTSVLGLELRDVIRVCFQPSAQGNIVDKYYQILAINSQTDVERDHITFTVASLDNLPIRLDSILLAVLGTDTLA
jgi:hypothetical protein